MLLLYVSWGKKRKHKYMKTSHRRGDWQFHGRIYKYYIPTSRYNKYIIPTTWYNTIIIYVLLKTQLNAYIILYLLRWYFFVTRQPQYRPYYNTVFTVVYKIRTRLNTVCPGSTSLWKCRRRVTTSCQSHNMAFLCFV